MENKRNPFGGSFRCYFDGWALPLDTAALNFYSEQNVLFAAFHGKGARPRLIILLSALKENCPQRRRNSQAARPGDSASAEAAKGRCPLETRGL